MDVCNFILPACIRAQKLEQTLTTVIKETVVTEKQLRDEPAI